MKLRRKVARAEDGHQAIPSHIQGLGIPESVALAAKRQERHPSGRAFSSEVRVKKTRQIRNLELRFDSIGNLLQADGALRRRRFERQRNAHGSSSARAMCRAIAGLRDDGMGERERGRAPGGQLPDFSAVPRCGAELLHDALGEIRATACPKNSRGGTRSEAAAIVTFTSANAAVKSKASLWGAFDHAQARGGWQRILRTGPVPERHELVDRLEHRSIPEASSEPSFMTCAKRACSFRSAKSLLAQEFRR